MRRLAIATSILLSVFCLGELLRIGYLWSDIDPDRKASDLFTLLTVEQLVTGVVFVWWMYRARENVATAPHRYREAWLFWGWILPIVNLWFPKRIIDDIWRATDPAAGRRLVTWWWAMWILMIVPQWADAIWQIAVPGDIAGRAWINTAGLAVTITAAVLAIKVLWRITAMQTHSVRGANPAPAA